MAVRLNVVMNQSPPASPVAQRVGEGIVGEMIGRPGIDMVLVNTSSLEDAQSTDLLTLESITGDFVYLDWKAPEDVLSLFSRCRIDGKRFPHAQDPVAATEAASVTAPGRRIYIFDLNQCTSPDEVCGAVYELLRLRQVRTFSLASSIVPAPAKKMRGNDAVAEVRQLQQPPVKQQSVGENTRSTSLPTVATVSSTNSADPPGKEAVSGSVSGSSRGSSRESSRPGLSEDQLDALVDQLNADELG